jgi:hypothetical protein
MNTGGLNAFCDRFMIGIGTETAIPAGCHGDDIMPQRIGPDGFSEVINEISIQVLVNDSSDIIFTKYLWIHHDSSARSDGLIGLFSSLEINF